MAIEIANVETGMFAGVRPWHEFGTRLPLNIKADEAIVTAGLDWEVVLKEFEVENQAVERYRATVRSSDKKVLGIVQERYTPIQNAEMFAFAESLVKIGGAHYHTAGALDGGRRVWILLELNDVIKVGKGDITKKYLLLTGSHDRTASFRCLFTPIRVVCQNTLNAALRGSAMGVSIRHTTTAVDRMKLATATLGAAQKDFDVFSQFTAHLATKKFDSKMLKTFVEQVFPSDKDEDEIPTQLQTKRDNVIYLFDHGKGHDKIKGTAWAALNAVVEFADYAYGRKGATAEKRAASVLYGSAALLKQDATDIMQKLAA